MKKFRDVPCRFEGRAHGPRRLMGGASGSLSEEKVAQEGLLRPQGP